MIKIKNRLFFILSSLMAIVVVLSNYLVQFPFTYFNLENLLTFGAFSYPVAFLITDLANRSYGKNNHVLYDVKYLLRENQSDGRL